MRLCYVVNVVRIAAVETEGHGWHDKNAVCLLFVTVKVWLMV